MVQFGDEDTAGDWSAAGNVIAAYGPSLNPHPSGIDTTYYLYSANGEKIAEIDGPGSWVPVAMPTNNGT